MFLTISLVFFQIKRCSKWHFNPLNNSFLPLEEKFTPGLIFFELLKAPKNTLLWPFQVNFNGIWTFIWTLLAVHEYKICPSLSISEPNLTYDRPNFMSIWPRHLEESTLSWLRPFNASKVFLQIWPPTTVKWLFVGQIWPCLGQFWAKPNNPNFVYHH